MYAGRPVVYGDSGILTNQVKHFVLLWSEFDENSKDIKEVEHLNHHYVVPCARRESGLPPAGGVVLSESVGVPSRRHQQASRQAPWVRIGMRQLRRTPKRYGRPGPRAG